ncbi:response regulator transcription factor [Kribbella swartbergensis]
MRIVIGEDSALFREGMVRLLEESGHEVVERVADAVALVDAVRRQQPDLVVVDVRMPPDLTDDGARAARRLREEFPTLPIMLLSQHIETTNSVELARQGYFGYQLKDRVLEVDDFLDLLELIHRGGSALDPLVVTRLLGPGDRDDPLKQLTSRERLVLGLMAEGRTNLGIARQMYLSDRTVETHVTSILHKLGIPDDVRDNRRVLAVLTFLHHRATS